MGLLDRLRARPANGEAEFLREINRFVPDGVDWKQGAIDYLSSLVRTGGAHNEQYHLIKPFLGGPDFASFYSELYLFLNLFEKLGLPMKARVVDVACGPGWVSHFLGKLGYTVLGIDISEELLGIARRRVSGDPYPPYPGVPFQVTFKVHDIEAEPLEAAETPFDAAVFESAVHHFFNPVAALRNGARGLRAGGILAIIEGASPEADFRPHFKQNVEAMERYRTLERPYTRPQMERLLALAGFPHFQFFHPVNGLFEQVQEVGRRVGHELLTADNWNIVVASATPEPIERISAVYRKDAKADPRVRFMEGFYAEEVGEGGVAFRWSEPRSVIRLRGTRRLRLEISTSCPQTLHKDQQVWVYVDGALSTRLVLTEKAPRVPLSLDDLEGKKELQLYSDCLFSPFWFGPPDDRSLSFRVGVEEIG